MIFDKHEKDTASCVFGAFGALLGGGWMVTMLFPWGLAASMMIDVVLKPLLVRADGF